MPSDCMLCQVATSAMNEAGWYSCSLCTHSTEGCYGHDIVQMKWEYQNRSYIHMKVIKRVVDIYPRDCPHGSIESALCILLLVLWDSRKLRPLHFQS